MKSIQQRQGQKSAPRQTSSYGGKYRVAIEAMSPLHRRWLEQRNRIRRVPLDDLIRRVIGLAVVADFSKRFVNRVELISMVDLPWWEGISREVVLLQGHKLCVDQGGAPYVRESAWAHDFRTMPFGRSFHWLPPARLEGDVRSPFAGNVQLVECPDGDCYVLVDDDPILRLPKKSALQFEATTGQVEENGLIGRFKQPVFGEQAHFNGHEASGLFLNSRRHDERFRLGLALFDSMTDWAIANQWQEFYEDEPREGQPAPEYRLEGFGLPYYQWSHKEEAFGAHEHAQREDHYARYNSGGENLYDEIIRLGAPPFAMQRPFMEWIKQGAPIWSDYTGKFVQLDRDTAVDGQALLRYLVTGEDRGTVCDDLRVLQTIPASAILAETEGQHIAAGTVVAYGCTDFDGSSFSDFQQHLRKAEAGWPAQKSATARMPLMYWFIDRFLKQHSHCDNEGTYYPRAFFEGSALAQRREWTTRPDGSRREMRQPRHNYFDLDTVRPYYDAALGAALLPPFPTAEGAHLDSLMFQLGEVSVGLSPRSRSFRTQPAALKSVA